MSPPGLQGHIFCLDISVLLVFVSPARRLERRRHGTTSPTIGPRAPCTTGGCALLNPSFVLEALLHCIRICENCVDTDIASIPTTPPTTPAISQRGNKLNYLFFVAPPSPFPPYTRLRCIPDTIRHTNIFPERSLCIIPSTLHRGKRGEQSPQKRVVKFVAGRMVFPVGHLTLTFKFPGGTSGIKRNAPGSARSCQRLVRSGSFLRPRFVFPCGWLA